MKKKLTERELAKQVIKELEGFPNSFSGICSVLLWVKGNSSIRLELPKLYKHLSQRQNYHYNVNGDLVGRRYGFDQNYFLWKEYNHKPRIAILKKIYNIK